MSAAQSCRLCRYPLAAVTPSGLCAECQTKVGTGDTERGSVTGDTATFATPAAADLSANAFTLGYDSLGLSTATLAPDGRATALPRMPAGYQALALLGRGGMGVVVKANEVAAERVVALKLMSPAAAASLRDRFAVEVRAVARLRHPNVVPVLALGLDHADPFYTMEYVPGGSLADRLRPGPMPVAEAVRVAAVIARAVHDLHAAGVLHRDLKPSNVLLTPDGVPMLADFGLAKRLDRDDDLTVTHDLLGTPEYMSPEQAGRRNDAQDARTDVYGIGATLYALLTNRPPFRGKDMLDTLDQVQSKSPVRPRARRADVPAEVEAIALRCLEKNPARRYQTAAELADDLERWRAGERTVARPVSWVGRAGRAVARRQATVATAALVTAALMFGVWAATGGRWLPPVDTGRRLPAPAPRPELPRVPGTAVLASAPALTAEQVRDELRAGRAVDLIDPTGPRVPLAWGLGSGEIVPPPTGDVAFSLRSRYTTVLHLAETAIDRYQVRAEVREELKEPLAGGLGSSAFARVGLAVGHVRARLDDNAVLHTLAVVDFAEAEPGGVAGQPARLTDWAALELPLKPLQSAHYEGPSVPLSPAGTDRPWRVVSLVVTPESLTLEHAGQTVTRSVGDIRGFTDRLADDLRSVHRVRTDATAPRWKPELPLGLWVRGAWVSVRRLTVEPLP